jgi:hypothetical protein
VLWNQMTGTSRPESTEPVVTDDDGRYRFSNLPAGSYIVSPITPAFVVPSDTMYGRPGKVVTLGEDEAVTDVDLSLTRGGVITGRVTDPNGRPLVKERVRLSQIDAAGRAMFVNPGMQFNLIDLLETDDRGVYRIYGLATGRYTVSAAGPRGVSAGSARARYAEVFYPGVSDEKQAGIITVTPGGEASGIDIVVGAATRTFSAYGRLVDADSNRPQANLAYGFGQLDAEGRQVGRNSSSAWRSGPQGEFRIDNLSPGHYAAFAQVEGGGLYYSDLAKFEIVDGDARGIEVRVRKAGSISGTVSIEGVTDPAVAALLVKGVELTVIATPQTWYGFGSPAKIAADGSFSIGGLPPGKFLIAFRQSPVTQGLAIVRLEQGDAVLGETVSLSAAEHLTGIRVILARGTGTIRGQIKFDGADPPEAVRTIVLYRRIDGAPTEASATSPRSQSSQVDSRGRFLLTSLLPGEYEIVATVLPAPPPRPLVRIRPARQRVTLANGSDIEVVLTLQVMDRPR